MAKERFQYISVQNKTFIVTTGRVCQNDLYCFLKNEFLNMKYAMGSMFEIFAGAHGHVDGRLGDSESDDRQLLRDIAGQLRGYEDDVVDIIQQSICRGVMNTS